MDAWKGIYFQIITKEVMEFNAAIKAEETIKLTIISNFVAEVEFRFKIKITKFTCDTIQN